MRTVSVAQMREADRRCIEEVGIPGVVLMHNAGAAVYREVDSGPVGIVCGKGNNGGDGFVVARLSLQAGMETRVLLVAERDGITGDALIFLHAYEHLGGEVIAVREPAEISEGMRSLDSCAVIVDALLGTGIEGEVRGPCRHVIQEWPEVRTIAVDVPSGLNADTGEVCGCCVAAETTVTLAAAKTGFDNPSASAYLGRLVIADIGIPDVCMDDSAWHRLKHS